MLLLKPEAFHGNKSKRPFFEGWYHKLTTKSNKSLAIIPGIYKSGQSKNETAFIMVFDGSNKKVFFERYSTKEFECSKSEYKLYIGSNYFSLDEIKLDISSKSFQLNGRVTTEYLKPWPVSLFEPGCMGWYTYIPTMECFHGILSMDHSLSGKLELNKSLYNFSDGRGYIEKDWGHSFPLGYVWMQSNHFSKSEISFKLSVAKIPMKGFSFIGFIAGVWVNSELIEFTTYNFSNLRKCSISKEEVSIEMDNNKYKLIAKATRSKSTKLAAPIQGFMDSRIEESMNSKINLVLIDKKINKSIIDDIGSSACIEVAGNYSLLLK